MKKEDIKLSDWQRILMGDAPFEFLLEIIVRSVFIYLVLLVVIRLLGKRMSGQLTITEMGIMLALGAIVALPMHSKDKSVLQGAELLFIIYFLHRALTYLTNRSTKFEDLVQGKMSLLVKNGMLQVEALQKSKISREQLFAVLRNEQIYNLGSVKRMYQEACGIFSIYKEKDQKPGLSLLPSSDAGVNESQTKVHNGTKACGRCGYTSYVQPTQVCPHCGANHEWHDTVL